MDSVANHLVSVTFNQVVLGSSPRRLTSKLIRANQSKKYGPRQLDSPKRSGAVRLNHRPLDSIRYAQICVEMLVA